MGTLLRVFGAPLFGFVVVGCGQLPGSENGSTTSSSGTSSGTLTGGTSSGSAGSSGSSGTSSGSTSGTSGTSSGTSGTSGTSGGDPVAACISACEAKYPAGTTLGKGIDACWAKNCSKECNNIGTGAPKGPKTGTCGHEVSTPSADCSQCTVDHCCAAWDACFGDAQCSALNTCSIACYK